MKKTAALCALILIPIIIYSKTIWVEKNLYSSGDNLSVGDIVTVVVQDISQLQFDVTSKHSIAGSVESNPDINITGFFPKVGGNKSVKNNDDFNYSEKRKMSFSLGARVQNIDQTGKLVITGSRVYSFNGTSNIITVNGTVDSAKVKSGSVYSTDMADFRLMISGSTEGMRIQRPPLGANETGELNLTEQEKRDMLIRYFEQMINLLEK
jgi:flagellar basal body L-ring protein FlgH